MAGLLEFTGKRVVITGAASGIGAATAQLLAERGAEVIAVDLAPVEQGAVGVAHRCDLGSRESIDSVAAVLPDRVDALMNCAGIPNGGRYSPEQVVRVNWLGLRHLTESVLPRIPRGGSVVHIASTAGRDWPLRAAHHAELMAAATFEAGLAWLDQHPGAYGDGYAFSKEAVQYYTLWRSVRLLPTGVRMNSVCPGVTDTSIVADFRRGLGDALIDHAQAIAGRMARPAEIAPAMLFLADPAVSSYVNGVNLNIDGGTGAAWATGQADPASIWGGSPPLAAEPSPPMRQHQVDDGRAST
jgi:NAD(P)-dependent dehydrogenase (short-subunit alcohol dehydrogenase family)